MVFSARLENGISKTELHFKHSGPPSNKDTPSAKQFSPYYMY